MFGIKIYGLGNPQVRHFILRLHGLGNPQVRHSLLRWLGNRKFATLSLFYFLLHLGIHLDTPSQMRAL